MKKRATFQTSGIDEGERSALRSDCYTLQGSCRYLLDIRVVGCGAEPCTGRKLNPSYIATSPATALNALPDSQNIDALRTVIT
jgi:hypothetical protein